MGALCRGSAGSVGHARHSRLRTRWTDGHEGLSVLSGCRPDGHPREPETFNTNDTGGLDARASPAAVASFAAGRSAHLR